MYVNTLHATVNIIYIKRVKMYPTQTNEIKLIQDQKDILEVRLEITQDCNLSCKYCIAKYSKNVLNVKDLLPDLINKVSDAIIEHNYKYIILTVSGGEPLIEIDTLIHTVLKFGSEVKKFFNIDIEVKILTNGILLKQNSILKKLSILNKIYKTELIISIHNVQSYKDFNRYVQSLIDHNIKFYTRKPISNEKDFDQLKEIKVDDIFPAFESYHNIKYLEDKGKYIMNWYKPGFLFNDNEITPKDLWFKTNFNFKGYSCNSGKNLICIGVDSRVYPCSIYLHKDIHTENSGINIKDFKFENTICNQTECWCFTTCRKGSSNE